MALLLVVTQERSQDLQICDWQQTLFAHTCPKRSGHGNAACDSDRGR
jgi:hypothetical protein